MSHHSAELNELIVKMHTVSGFEIVFHKIIEENWKIFCVEISYSNNIIIIIMFRSIFKF